MANIYLKKYRHKWNISMSGKPQVLSGKLPWH